MNNLERRNQLMPNGIPRYIRCYDNGGITADRYTIVYTGRYRKSRNDDFIYFGSSTDPYHPQGIGQHGFCKSLIDRPAYKHLGKPVTFESLPNQVKKAVLSDYEGIWFDPPKEQLYKVVKIYRGSGRRQLLRKNLNVDQAQSIVRSFPNNQTSMVVYIKQ